VSLDDLRELSESFGDVLRHSLDDLQKVAEIRGGGLRHGEIEWQVSYVSDGLRRLLLFDLGELPGRLVTVSARAAATDESGHWASAVAGSTSLPHAVLVDQLAVLVPQLLNQTRFVANTLQREHLRPMLLSTMD
jgi:hypothetical protein